jgi:EmrB/QacA subfamily drug resistance transporter
MIRASGDEDKRRVLLIIGALLVAQFLSGLDTIIVVTALPTIVGDLGGLSELSWVVTVYLLSSTIASPILGKLSDLMGRKALFLLSLIIFLGGSALAGLSHSILQLIVFRAVQGIGGGGLGVLSRIIVADVVPGRQLGRVQGIMSSTFAVSSVAGPLIGGLLVQHVSWRWIFYVNIPFGLAILVVAAVVLPKSTNRAGVTIDYLGSLLLAVSVIAFLLATTWAGSRLPWNSPEIFELLLGGLVCAFLFVSWERRAREPIMPTRLFRDRVFTISSASGFVLGMAMFGPWVVLPLFLQVVTGVSATDSGLLMLPLLVTFTATSVIVGFLITRYGKYRVFPIIGTTLMLVGFFLYTRMGAHSSRLEVSVYMAVVGMGIGLMLEVLTIAVQNAVHPKDLGAATAGVGFFNSIGGTFGTAVYLSIMNIGLAHWLPRLLPAGVRLRPSVLEGSPSEIKSLPPAIHNAVVNSFAFSIHTVLLYVVPLAAIGLLMVVFLPSIPLREVSVSDLLLAEGGPVVLPLVTMNEHLAAESHHLSSVPATDTSGSVP